MKRPPNFAKIPTSFIIIVTLIVTIINSTLTSVCIPLMSELPNALGNDSLLKSKMFNIVMLYIAGAVIGALLAGLNKTSLNKIIDSETKKLIGKEFTCKIRYIMANHSGKLNADITNYAKLTALLNSYAMNILNIVIILGNMLMQMGAKVGLHAPVICLSIMSLEAVLFRIVFKKFSMSKVHEANSKLSALTQDIMQNVKTLRYLNKSDWALEKLSQAQDNALNLSTIHTTRRAFFSNLIGHMSVAPILICIWLLRESCDVELATFVIMSEWAIDSGVGCILNVIDTLSERSDVKRRISFLDDEDNSSAKPIKDGVKMKDIVFGYKDNDILFKVKDLFFKKNERYVLTGESGQGKSSLANLLVGVNEPIEGILSKHKVFYVHQETECLDMSIRDNICMGADISDEELMDMLTQIGMKDWVDSLDNGLDTVIGERGTNVSSGQKQRLNILRSVIEMKALDDDTLIIMDEPTSNLDDETEKSAIEVIDSACKGTLLVITHRPAIKEICDHELIVVNHEFKEV